jgi:DNA (cytosine-5)-methyltransferase 1
MTSVCNWSTPRVSGCQKGGRDRAGRRSGRPAATSQATVLRLGSHRNERHPRRWRGTRQRCGRRRERRTERRAGRTRASERAACHCQPRQCNGTWRGTFIPPGPGDSENWQAALERAPELEPAFRRVADGLASRLDIARVDRLRMLGNGVVPLQAAYAVRTLATRLAAAAPPAQLALFG